MDFEAQLLVQNQRLLQHLNTSRLNKVEIRQLLTELLGQPLDETNQIDLPFYLDQGCRLKLGRHVAIQANVTLQAIGGLTIGDDVTIGAGVMCLTQMYQLNQQQQPQLTTAPIKIGQGVKLGSCSIIQAGTVIGANVIVQPGAVVSGIIPKQTVIAGNPARPI